MGAGAGPQNLQLLPDLVQPGAGSDGRARYHVRVASDVLGRRVDDSVDTKLERPLHRGACPGVISDGEHSPGTGEARHRLEVDDPQGRIRWSLQVHQFRVLPERPFESRWLLGLDNRRLDAEVPQ